jgi:hypothetical protein
LATVVALACVATASLPGPAEALRVRLRARTALTLQLEVGGAGLTVTGQLEDSRGKPVAAAGVVVRALPDKGDGAPPARQERLASTDAAGRFEVLFPRSALGATERTWQIEGRFAGGPEHGESVATQTVDLAKPDATLVLALETERVRSSQVTLAMDVEARAGDWPIAGGAVQLAVDGRPLLVLRTAADGRATAQLSVATLGGPGLHRLTARIEPGDVHNGAEAGRRLELVTAVEVELSLTQGHKGKVCGEGDWCLAGAVLALEGAVRHPVPSATVGLHADGHQLGLLVTDLDGRFAGVLRGAVLSTLFPPGAVGVVARAYVPAPFHETGLSAIAVVDVPPPPGLSGWWYGGPLIGLALAAVLLRWNSRRRERALLAQDEAKSAGLPDEAVRRVGPGGQPSCVVRGRIVHGETGRPVAGELHLLLEGAPKTVEISCPSGIFDLHGLPPGRHRLRVACVEHEPLDIGLVLPHDGVFDGCELLPSSCRAVVRGSFAGVLRRVTGMGVDWRMETPRDVEPRWAAGVRRGHGEVRDAVRKVERALYGARTDPDTAKETQQAISKVDEVQR